MKFWLICFFISIALSQTQSTKALTLYQLAQQQSNSSSSQTKAIQFMAKAHPELWNYTVVSISSNIQRGNQTYADNLEDYLFQLDNQNITITVLVTLSNTVGEQFVSVSPLVVKDQETRNEGQYYIILNYPKAPKPNLINQTTSTDYKKNTYLKKLPLGSYMPFPNNEDPLLEYSLDYVASLHPNIVNYELTQASYQIVAGVKIKLEYLGMDKTTQLEVVVYFDLEVRPSIYDFQVSCWEETLNPCQKTMAWDLYHGIEGIMLIHPELMEYRIINVMTDSGSVPTKVLVTFQNSEEGLRVLSELAVSSEKSVILSFFTYQFSSY